MQLVETVNCIYGEMVFFHVQQGADFNAMAGINYAVVMLATCKTGI